MGTAEVAAALDAAAAAGPFFVLDADPSPAPRVAPSEAAGPPWRPFAELTNDPDVLRARIAAIRAGIAERGRLDTSDVPERAAASLAHLGLVARLVAPPMGAGLLGGAVPDLGAGTLSWRDVLGPVPLALPGATGRRVDPGDAAAIAEAVAAGLEDGPVRDLTDAVADVARVSRQVLWGNVASAVGGAVIMLVAAAPGRAPVAAELGARLVARAPLTGTGQFARPRTPAAAPQFRRTSCCLYYRVPGGGLCGDCVLTARPARPRGEARASS